MAVNIHQINPSLCFPTHPLTPNHSDQFIGRRSDLRDGTQSLLSPDRMIFVYGDRGMGKSSLAFQIASIAEDSNATFKKSQFGVPEDEASRLLFSVNARRTMQSFSGLVWEIIRPSTSKTSFYQSYASIYKDTSIAAKINMSLGASIFDIAKGSVELSSKAASILDSVETTELTKVDSISIFYTLLQKIRDSHNLPEPIFIIDEIDRLPNPDGFGEFIKNVDYGRFVFVAASDSLLSFVADHESAARQVYPSAIPMKAMRSEDIEQICGQANRASGGVLVFPPATKKFFEDSSFGYPWIIQNIGKFALKAAIEARKSPNVARLTVRVPNLEDLKAHFVGLDDDPNRWLGLSSNPVQTMLLSLLLERMEPLSMKTILSRMPAQFVDDTRVVVGRLLESGIICETRGLLHFPGALHRLICFISVKTAAEH